MFLNNPEYVRIGEEKYKINTDFRVAIKCNEIAIDNSINEYEKPLAIIYLLFGDKGLDNEENYNKLIELALKYLSCGKELKSDEKPDMDFTQDMGYIKASFRSDFGIDLNKEEMHLWDFFELMNGLSNSEFGNCCVLNKIRNARNYDASKIQDAKERSKFIEFQKSIALNKDVQLTKEQEESIKRLDEIIGLRKE